MFLCVHCSSALPVALSVVSIFSSQRLSEASFSICLLDSFLVMTNVVSIFRLSSTFVLSLCFLNSYCFRLGYSSFLFTKQMIAILD